MRGITPLKSASPQITAPVPGQTLLLANVTSDGIGGFRVTPERPVQEIGSADAAKLLRMSRGNLSLTVNSRLGQKHLRWRWLTEKKGKRVFDRDSVIAYREALKHWNNQLERRTRLVHTLCHARRSEPCSARFDSKPKRGTRIREAAC